MVRVILMYCVVSISLRFVSTQNNVNGTADDVLGNRTDGLTLEETMEKMLKFIEEKKFYKGPPATPRQRKSCPPTDVFQELNYVSTTQVDSILYVNINETTTCAFLYERNMSYPEPIVLTIARSGTHELGYAGSEGPFYEGITEAKFYIVNGNDRTTVANSGLVDGVVHDIGVYSFTARYFKIFITMPAKQRIATYVRLDYDPYWPPVEEGSNVLTLIIFALICLGVITLIACCIRCCCCCKANKSNKPPTSSASIPLNTSADEPYGQPAYSAQPYPVQQPYQNPTYPVQPYPNQEVVNTPALPAQPHFGFEKLADLSANDTTPIAGEDPPPPDYADVIAAGHSVYGVRSDPVVIS